jgi:hypothetical protein
MATQDRAYLETLDKTELIELILGNAQPAAAGRKHLRDEDGAQLGGKKHKKNKTKPFEGLNLPFRQVALKLSYIGENYHGFVTQEGSNTVEVGFGVDC